MSRKHRRPAAHTEHHLVTCHDHGWTCGEPLWGASTKRRTRMTLAGLIRLHLPVRRWRNPVCPRSHRP